MQYMEKIDPSINKMDWGEGEWQHEPDKIQFLDEKTGYPCLIVRNNYGALCGYVGISPGHKHYGEDLSSYDKADSLEVHGGITFASGCQEGNSDFGVCHLVDDGEEDNVWWIGFDCAHLGDLEPNKYGRKRSIVKPILDAACPEFLLRNSSDQYRNIEYVKNEIKNLACQLKLCEA